MLILLTGGNKTLQKWSDHYGHYIFTKFHENLWISLDGWAHGQDDTISLSLHKQSRPKNQSNILFNNYMTRENFNIRNYYQLI
jgi:hypothetical protein